MDEIIAILGVFSLLVFLIGLIVIVRWFYSWKGFLRNKIVKEEWGASVDESDYSPGCTRKFVLIFETTDGRTIREEVDEKKFEVAVIGDKYEKTPKSWNIKKV